LIKSIRLWSRFCRIQFCAFSLSTLEWWIFFRTYQNWSGLNDVYPVQSLSDKIKAFQWPKFFPFVFFHFRYEKCWTLYALSTLKKVVKHDKPDSKR